MGQSATVRQGAITPQRASGRCLSAPRQGINPVARTKHKDNMKFLLTLASILFCFFTIGSTAPQHTRVRRGDGYQDVGGVYDSPAAQAYWATRFGAGFFTDLRALAALIGAILGQSSIHQNHTTSTPHQCHHHNSTSASSTPHQYQQRCLSIRCHSASQLSINTKQEPTPSFLITFAYSISTLASLIALRKSSLKPSKSVMVAGRIKACRSHLRYSRRRPTIAAYSRTSSASSGVSIISQTMRRLERP